MICTHCMTGETKVIESRDVADGKSIRRRRECMSCAHRFTTYERVERPPLIVIKKDGTRELFDRDKLFGGIQRACQKTPVTSMQIETLIAEIEEHLYQKGEPEIQSVRIGDLAMEKLAALNEVAYVRFASVYRRFKDIASFEDELSHFKEIKKAK